MPSRLAITDNGSGRAGSGATRNGSFILYPHPVLRLLPGAFEPVEHLGRRVDLVVVLAFWKDRQLVQVFGEPRRLLGQLDKAVCGRIYRAARFLHNS